MNKIDTSWIDALRPYLGGGIVPCYYKPDGTIDPVKTVDQFCSLKGCKKLDPNTGEEL